MADNEESAREALFSFLKGISAQHRFLAKDRGKLGGFRTVLLPLGRLDGGREGRQGDGLEGRDGMGGILFAGADLAVLGVLSHGSSLENRLSSQPALMIRLPVTALGQTCDHVLAWLQMTDPR